MNWSLDLGEVFGIRIRVHWLFLLLLGWLLLFDGLASAAMVAVVFFFVVLHELGHSLVARRYGVRVRDITLLPIGGVARLEDAFLSPQAELRIALAGPLVNIALAAVLLPLALVAGAGRVAFGANVLGSLADFLGALVAVNLALALFNLLPAFPMDGGRVLRSWLARSLGMVEATRKAARVGRWVAGAMAVAGLLLLRPMLLLIALFVFLAGLKEETTVRLRYMRVPTISYDPYYGWRVTLREGPFVDLREIEDYFRRLMRQGWWD